MRGPGSPTGLAAEGTMPMATNGCLVRTRSSSKSGSPRPNLLGGGPDALQGAAGLVVFVPL